MAKIEQPKAMSFFLEIFSLNNITENRVEKRITPMFATGNTVEEGSSSKLSNNKYMEK